VKRISETMTKGGNKGMRNQRNSSPLQDERSGSSPQTFGKNALMDRRGKRCLLEGHQFDTQYDGGENPGMECPRRLVRKRVG